MGVFGKTARILCQHLNELGMHEEFLTTGLNLLKYADFTKLLEIAELDCASSRGIVLISTFWFGMSAPACWSCARARWATMHFFSTR